MKNNVGVLTLSGLTIAAFAGVGYLALRRYRIKRELMIEEESL